MEKKKYTPDNIEELFREKAVEFLNFLETFDRKIEDVGIKNPNNVFQVNTIDNEEVIKIKLKFFTQEEKQDITKLQSDQKLTEAELKMVMYGIKDWNLADEKGEKLPINLKTLSKLNDVLFKYLSSLVRAKNREPDAEEMQNFLIL